MASSGLCHMGIEIHFLVPSHRMKKSDVVLTILEELEAAPRYSGLTFPFEAA